MSTNLVIFASGRGSNANQIASHFSDNSLINVALIISNNSNAGVHQVASRWHIPSIHLSKKEINDAEILIQKLDDFEIDFIVLAGFMLLIPSFLISIFEKKIVNIHPALLPKYGGKGMYGNHVHNAVKENQESKTGITIHYVNEAYDEGQIIFQASCPILETDDVSTIADKVHELEHQYYPAIIQSVISERLANDKI